MPQTASLKLTPKRYQNYHKPKKSRQQRGGLLKIRTQSLKSEPETSLNSRKSPEWDCLNFGPYATKLAHALPRAVTSRDISQQRPDPVSLHRYVRIVQQSV
jgi:hypothetical protein